MCTKRIRRIVSAIRPQSAVDVVDWLLQRINVLRACLMPEDERYAITSYVHVSGSKSKAVGPILQQDNQDNNEDHDECARAVLS